ncbi:MAG: TolC family protein [Burkholderiales bacterium]|nr:TolC family protein [Burkholderiales bacterium]
MNRLAGGALLCAALCVPPAWAQTLSLEDAWRIAEQASPALNSARAARHAVEGQQAESAALLWNNPAVVLDPVRRTVPQASGSERRMNEWHAGVAQTFEIAGQQGLRRETARLDLAALERSVEDIRRQVRADVEERFVRVLALQRRLALETENLGLVQSAAQAVRKRVAAGEASRLDGNLAAVEAERIRNQLGQLAESLISARAELAQLMQLDPGKLPEADGEIAKAAGYSRDALLESASRRPQLQALAQREDAARTRLDFERAAAVPDITLGVSAGREGPTDMRENLVGVTVSLPLPLFRRNQAGIGRAMSDLTATQIERQAAQRDVRAAVLSIWPRVERLRERSARLRSAVLPPLEENLRLSRRAFAEGEIGLTELLLVNRQVLDGRRDALEAETELRLAQVALERAAGWTH